MSVVPLHSKLPSEGDVLDGLADMSAVEYEQRRDDIAKQLGCRVRFLDEERKARAIDIMSRDLSSSAR